MEEEEDRGVSLARSRSTISDRRFSYLERDLERDAPRRVSREEEKEKKRGKRKRERRKEDRKRNKLDNWAKGEGESTNNNNKQRYRQGLMLILIDRAIHDPDFNFGRCTMHFTSRYNREGA